MISYTTSNFLLFSISYTLSKFRKQSYFFLRLMNLGHSKIMWWILGQILYKYFLSKVCPVIIFVNFFFFCKMSFTVGDVDKFLIPFTFKCAFHHWNWFTWCWIYIQNSSYIGCQPCNLVNFLAGLSEIIS